MTKSFSLALLVAGIAMIAYSLSSSNSVVSSFSRLFTGSPTDKTVWLMIGGVAAASFGFAGALRGSKIR